MIAAALAALIGNYMTTCFIIGLVIAAVLTIRHRASATTATISGWFVNAYVLWAIGIAQLTNFVMHSVFGDYAAKTIGWAQSPFQLELAFSSLGVGVMAIILQGHGTQLRAKIALIVATVIFGFGAAGGHIYQMIGHHDYAANNTGLLLTMDLLIPITGLALTVWHTMALRHHSTPTGAAAPTLSAAIR
jgi:hypothetical protein